MKRGIVLVLMFLLLSMRALGEFTVGGDQGLQRAPGSSSSTVVAIAGIVIVVFLIYWFVFRKKK